MISNRTHQLMHRPRHGLNTMVFAATLLAAGGAMAQGKVSVVGQRAGHSVSSEVSEINSCVTAFIHQLFPGSSPVVRTVVSRSDANGWRTAISGTTLVIMNAAVRSTGKLVAQSDCLVSSNAQVKRLHVQVLDATLLASIAPQELSVVMASR